MTPSPTWKSDLSWATLAGAITALEIFTIRTNRLDSTLTRTTRRLFRTRHPIGKTLFAMGFGAFSVWFVTHIVESEHPMDLILNSLKGEPDADDS